jgi:cysteine desulfurase
MDAHAAELKKLRAKLEKGVLAVKDSRLNGPKDGRLPGTAHFSFQGLEGSALVVALDMEGVCVSAGSACSTGAVDPSHVLSAMGIAPDWALGSLRVSMGWGTTERDVDRLLAVLPKAVEKMRAAHRALSA